jgi:hypothetical protein
MRVLERIQKDMRVADARFIRAGVLVLFAAGVRCDEQSGWNSAQLFGCMAVACLLTEDSSTHRIGLTA